MSSNLISMSSQASACSIEHGCVTSWDRISQLPDDVLDKIFSLMTVRDGVKTSAVSPLWKCLWASKNGFTLDWINIFGKKENSDYWESCEDPCLVYEEKFVRAINQLLTSYQGSHIASFKISFCLGKEFASDIDRWLSFAIRMGAETLWVYLECDKLCSEYREDLAIETNDDKFVFSRDIFHGIKSNIRDLHLVGCKLGPDLSIEFTSLQTLVLYYAPLASYDLQTLFSYMGKLGELTLNLCRLPRTLCFGSLTKLKNLTIVMCCGLREITLSNVNLVYFEYVDEYMDPLETSVNLEGAPNLVTFISGGNVLNLNYIFTCLPLCRMVRDFTLITDIDWVAEIPDSLAIFNNVRQLKLMFIPGPTFDVRKMISILRAFPSLQKLYLGIKCPSDSNRGNYPETLEIGHVRQHQQLEEVEIYGFYGTCDQIQLVVYLLEHASALKRLIIRREIDTRLGNGLFGFFTERPSWNKGEYEKICEKLPPHYRDILDIDH